MPESAKHVQPDKALAHKPPKKGVSGWKGHALKSLIVTAAVATVAMTGYSMYKGISGSGSTKDNGLHCDVPIGYNLSVWPYSEWATRCRP